MGRRCGSEKDRYRRVRGNLTTAARAASFSRRTRSPDFVAGVISRGQAAQVHVEWRG